MRDMKDVKIVKIMKVKEEIASVQVSQQYSMFVIINQSGNL